MTWHSEKPVSARRGLLAVLMLAVLAASVGAAWLLDASARRRTAAAGAIVKQIRTAGLRHFWPEKPQIDWYLIREGSNITGWSATARQRTAEGNFTGVYVEVAPRQHRIYEKWMLNADAAGGAYFAVLHLADGKALETTINLTDGTVTVLQRRTGFGHVTARSRAENNYLPEGMFSLALQRVAAEQADAQFAMVFNEKLNPGGIVEFGTRRLQYIGEGKTPKGRSVRRVRLTEVRGGKKHTSVYELDEKGKILLVSGSDGYRRTAADEQAVKKAFKDAPAYLRKFLPKATGDGG